MQKKGAALRAVQEDDVEEAGKGSPSTGSGRTDEGALPARLSLSADDRRRWAPAPRPDLAPRLERAARVPIEQKVGAAWPSLRLVNCWTAGSAGLYVPELQRRGLFRTHYEGSTLRDHLGLEPKPLRIGCYSRG